MCFGGTELLQVTVTNISVSKIPSDSLFTYAIKAIDDLTLGTQVPTFVFTTSPGRRYRKQEWKPIPRIPFS